MGEKRKPPRELLHTPTRKPAKRPKKKHPGGRPVKQLDLIQLERLCAQGWTNQEIADILRISLRTLQTRISDPTVHSIPRPRPKGSKAPVVVDRMTVADVMQRGFSLRNVSLRGWQIDSAKRGSVRMQIFLGKQWLGQKDNVEVEQTFRKGKTYDELLAEYVEMGGDPIGT